MPFGMTLVLALMSAVGGYASAVVGLDAGQKCSDLVCDVLEQSVR